MNISLSTGNTAPKPRFSAEGATISPRNLPNLTADFGSSWGEEQPEGGAQSAPPTILRVPHWLRGLRLVTSHACAPRVKGGRGSPRRTQDGVSRGTAVPKTAARGHAGAEQVWCVGRLLGEGVAWAKV